MSGASEATARLRTASLTAMSDIARAAQSARAAQVALQQADELMDVLAAAAALTLAAEALQAASKAAEASLRDALAEVMADTGCTAFETAGHTVSLRDSPPGFVITDQAALPTEFMVAPEPRPDRKLILAGLKRGPVPGAALSNRPPPVVSFKARNYA